MRISRRRIKRGYFGVYLERVLRDCKQFYEYVDGELVPCENPFRRKVERLEDEAQ